MTTIHAVITDAEIAVYKTLQSKDWQLPRDIANATSLPLTEVRVICAQLFRAGVVARNGGYPDFRYRATSVCLNQNFREFADALNAAVFED